MNDSNKMFQPRIRGHMPQKRFADQAKAAKAATTKSNYKAPDGLYDRLVLGQKSVWVRLSPEQIYVQEIYDRELKDVVEVTRQWFESTSHFVPSRNQPFNCSSGPRRDKPCRGCAIRAQFYDVLRDQEKSSDARNEEKRKNPPVQASTRYSMSVTVLEKILHINALDKNNKPKTNRQGGAIMNYVPAPLSGLSLIQQKTANGQFGHNYHWGFSATHLAQLADIDMTLWNSCKNCASDLMATEFHCTECEAVAYQDDNGIIGSDLRDVRETKMKCPQCSHEGFVQPVLSCTGCDTAAEGGLFAFDLQLRVVPTTEKNSDIKMDKFRVPDYSALFPTEAERVTELVYNPLDIPGIYAPDSVDRQAFKLPEELKNVGIDYHLKEKSSQAYGQTTDEEEADPNQMGFSS